jgi:hypothetical protein
MKSFGGSCRRRLLPSKGVPWTGLPGRGHILHLLYTCFAPALHLIITGPDCPGAAGLLALSSRIRRARSADSRGVSRDNPAIPIPPPRAPGCRQLPPNDFIQRLRIRDIFGECACHPASPFELQVAAGCRQLPPPVSNGRGSPPLWELWLGGGGGNRG